MTGPDQGFLETANLVQCLAPQQFPVRAPGHGHVLCRPDVQRLREEVGGLRVGVRLQRLLPRLRDPLFTHVLLVTLPEATPLHEAMQLERDLARADIKPFAWVVNQSLTPLAVTDPVLRARRAHEAVHLKELVGHAARIVLEPWSVGFAREATSPSPREAPASV